MSWKDGLRLTSAYQEEEQGKETAHLSVWGHSFLGLGIYATSSASKPPPKQPWISHSGHHDVHTAKPVHLHTSQEAELFLQQSRSSSTPISQ